MKKKMLFTTIAITGIIAAFNINAVEKRVSDISLLNIEMLSSEETGGSTIISCTGTGSVDCPNGRKVRAIW